VRAGPAGAWTQWLAATTATGANYAGGIAGQTYYFRSVAHDLAGNAETDLPADGDTLTTVAATQVTGRVSNNRDGPIFNATVNATPAMLNTPATTDGNGGYGLFDASTGVYALTASRAGYGALPARNGVDIAGTSTDLDFVLPPAEEIVVNGGWETGGLTGWQVGAEAIATVEAAAAHTGLGGLRLISPLASGPEPLWQITQTVSLPAGIVEPTLSWLTRVVSGDGAESLLVEVSNGSTAITHTLPLAPVGWMHAWKDLSAFSGQAVTLRIGFQGTTAAREVHLDEISIGATRIGSYSVYLPLVVRQ
jgi:hypothetical protein